MYAYMTSKVHNYKELQEYSRVCKKTKPIRIRIIDTIHLPDEELALFMIDFKKNQKWLVPYLNQMRVVEEGRWNCVLIASSEIPIVVYANMCLYPQYVGILIQRK